jgi:hypothetical protein
MANKKQENKGLKPSTGEERIAASTVAAAPTEEQKGELEQKQEAVRSSDNATTEEIQEAGLADEAVTVANVTDIEGKQLIQAKIEVQASGIKTVLTTTQVPTNETGLVSFTASYPKDYKGERMFDEEKEYQGSEETVQLLEKAGIVSRK